MASDVYLESNLCLMYVLSLLRVRNILFRDITFLLAREFLGHTFGFNMVIPRCGGECATEKVTLLGSAFLRDLFESSHAR